MIEPRLAQEIETTQNLARQLGYRDFRGCLHCLRGVNDLLRAILKASEGTSGSHCLEPIGTVVRE